MMIGVRVDVEQAALPGEGGGNGSDDAGIAPFRDVRHGFEQGH
jgi:hypothetical protein